MRPARNEGRGTRTLLGALLAAVTVSATTPPASAQEPGSDGRTPPVVRTGKWVALGMAAGATILGIRAHENADAAFSRLRDYCSSLASCDLGPDGRYTNAGAESLYLEVRNGDRAARAWLAAGQTLLVGSVVLFVMDLRNRGRPENEPLGHMVIEAGALGTTRIGWRMTLRD